MEHIRNFSIIAHIDHGKSTLADRLLEITGTVPRDKLREQFLDSMDLEREHGVTIKAHPVRMEYRGYVLNLLDTPGHVDFSYEVSRSIASCEGAVLLVDATQGVEAQTVTHYELAKEHGLVIIPVINKIDLPNADFENVAEEIIELTGCDLEDIILISAKEGIGIEELLDAVIERIPPPRGEPDVPLRALIFDSIYDDYRGAVPYVRIFDGEIRPGMKIKLFSTGREYEVMEVGHFRPQRVRADALKTGEVGWVIAGIKSIRDTRVGDTITDAKNPAERPLPGYREVKPMVFSGIYPSRGEDFEALGKALEKLKLNDASLTFQIEQSALGFGYRCGFLGLFHMEIVEERIEREYNIPIIATTPNVRYRVKTKKGEVFEIENPAKFPPMGDIEAIEEPIVRGEIITPDEYLGGIFKLCEEKRGKQLSMEYMPGRRVALRYEFPLAEILFDFHDKLKSVSRGYASFDYEFYGYRENDLVKIDILLNGKPVDALSFIVHREKAYHTSLKVVRKLKEVIPRQLFEVAIQAAIGKRVIARATIKPYRKDVTAKCYGGDVTRKRKLLEKQKEGKKRMKKIGHVDVPEEAFLAVLKIER